MLAEPKRLHAMAMREAGVFGVPEKQLAQGSQTQGPKSRALQPFNSRIATGRCNRSRACHSQARMMHHQPRR